MTDIHARPDTPAAATPAAASSAGRGGDGSGDLGHGDGGQHETAGAIVKNMAATWTWTDEADTAAFANRIASCPALANAFIELHGNLGAGKTTLVRHLLRALGVQGRIKSPTYAVVEPYELPAFNVWHFDFYRFSDPREWADAGFRDIFTSSGLKLAEWPAQAAGQLPLADLVVRIDVLADESRQVSTTAQTATGAALLAAAQSATVQA